MPGTDTPRLSQGVFRQLNKKFVVVFDKIYSWQRSLHISYINSNDKDIIPVFILNSDNVICKDPFFYRCDGGLCFDYLKACEEKYRTNVTESIEEK